MKPWLETAHATLYHGDSMEMLRSLPDNSVHVCVQSPPYWGLRDYEVEGQIGLEETPEQYIDRIVGVMREVRRVLREDGTLWLNIGDTYAGSGRGGYPGGKTGLQGSTEGQDQSRSAKETMFPAFREGSIGRHWVPPPAGFKQKEMLGLPWRVAFALQADGWYLRSEIIWHKRSAMPESCIDRPSKAHEQVFLFAKSPKYYFDQINAEEECTGNAHSRGHGINLKAKSGDGVVKVKVKQNESFSAAVTEVQTKRNQRTVWSLSSYALKVKHFAAYPPELVRRCLLSAPVAKGCCATCGKGWARVFTKIRVPTRPGTKSKVGSNWQTGPGRHDTLFHNSTQGEHPKNGRASQHSDSPYQKQNGEVVGNRDPQRHITEKKTVGWWPMCKCYGVKPSRRPNQLLSKIEGFDPALVDRSELVPCVVLDPFHGAGTTWKVAERLGANYIGGELNEEYLRLSVERPPVMFPYEKKAKRRRARAVNETQLQLSLTFDAD